jgi:hypothetical protein
MEKKDPKMEVNILLLCAKSIKILHHHKEVGYCALYSKSWFSRLAFYDYTGIENIHKERSRLA